MAHHLAKEEFLIKGHEGLRLRAYQDSLGVWTIGWGRNLIARGVSEAEAAMLLGNDLAEVRRDLRRRLPWIDRLDEVRLAVLVDMAFNLGVAGVLRFAQMLGHVERGEYGPASQAMLESRWARQVGRRAVRLCAMMQSGLWPAELRGPEVSSGRR